MLLQATFSLLTTSLLGISARPLPAPRPIIVRLESGPGVPGSVTDFYSFYAAETVNKIKSTLGPSTVADLVKNETDQADIYWKKILAQSDPDKPANTYARIGAVVDANVLNTTIFQAWFSKFATTGYPSRLLQSNPQHYLMSTNGTSRDVIEVTGKGPATHGIGVVEDKKAFMKELAEFPIQTFLGLELRDGTHLHDTQISFRDTEDGMEIEFDFYMPEKTPKDVLEAASEHVAIEASNWITFAYEDIVEGHWKPKTQVI